MKVIAKLISADGLEKSIDVPYPVPHYYHTTLMFPIKLNMSHYSDEVSVSVKKRTYKLDRHEDIGSDFLLVEYVEIDEP